MKNRYTRVSTSPLWDSHRYHLTLHVTTYLLCSESYQLTYPIPSQMIRDTLGVHESSLPKTICMQTPTRHSLTSIQCPFWIWMNNKSYEIWRIPQNEQEIKIIQDALILEVRGNSRAQGSFKLSSTKCCTSWSSLVHLKCLNLILRAVSPPNHTDTLCKIFFEILKL
jgi:hypothetical protein